VEWECFVGIRLDGRNGEIWRKFCRGIKQEALAEEYGISQQRVSQIINAVRETITPEERIDLLKKETDLLEELRAEVLELWDKGPSPAYAANGRQLEGVEDHSGRLAALARAESLTARLHRLVGLDAPQKVDLNLAGEEEASRRAAAEAVTHLHGGTEDE
jgi:transcriptional regulator with XRE-family HTH domain